MLFPFLFLNNPLNMVKVLLKEAQRPNKCITFAAVIIYITRRINLHHS